MQVAESYVQRLLRSANAIEAVGDIAAIWSARPNRSVEQPYFGLAEPEFNVHMCLSYTGEVMNGGHAQFFMNQLGRFTPETVEALRAVGLAELATILDGAASVFGDPWMIRDDDHRDSVLERLTPEQGLKFSAADAAFNRAFWHTDEACLAYLRAHDTEILLPERSA
jgi:hypothetical protein